MSKLNRIMMIAAVLVFVSAIGNVLYAETKKLGEPLMMMHYDEVVWDEDRDLELQIHYITNVEDERRLISLDFESLASNKTMVQQRGVNSFTFSWQGNQMYNDQVGRYYTMKTAYVQVSLDDQDITALNEEGSIKLSKASAGYSDGSYAVVDVGEMRLLSQPIQDNLVRPNHRGQGMPEFTASFKVQTPIEITSVDLPFVASHTDLLDFRILVDGNESYSLEDLQRIETPIKAKVYIELIYTSISGDLNSNWLAGRVHPEIHYSSSDGPGSFRSVFSQSNWQLDEKSVESYVNLWRQDNE